MFFLLFVLKMRCYVFVFFRMRGCVFFCFLFLGMRGCVFFCFLFFRDERMCVVLFFVGLSEF